jgi:hypothetical protein
MKNIKIGVRRMAKEKQVPPPGFRKLKRMDTNLIYNILLKFFKGVQVGSCLKQDCESTNIYIRKKEIKPKYRCEKCGNEFDYPKPKFIFPTNEKCYKKTKCNCNSHS